MQKYYNSFTFQQNLPIFYGDIVVFYYIGDWFMIYWFPLQFLLEKVVDTYEKVDAVDSVVFHLAFVVNLLDDFELR